MWLLNIIMHVQLDWLGKRCHDQLSDNQLVLTEATLLPAFPAAQSKQYLLNMSCIFTPTAEFMYAIVF